jgi:hypothetical protein
VLGAGVGFHVEAVDVCLGYPLEEVRGVGLGAVFLLMILWPKEAPGTCSELILKFLGDEETRGVPIGLSRFILKVA